MKPALLFNPGLEGVVSECGGAGSHLGGVDGVPAFHEKY